MTLRLLISCLTTLFIAGCDTKSNPSNYTTSAPKFEELIGTYTPTPQTHDLLKPAGKYPNSDSAITLNEDGTVKMVNVPDWWLTSYTDAKGKFDSGEGKWTMDRNKGWWLIVVTFSTQNNNFTTSLPSKGTVTAMLSLIGQKAPYKLQLSITDPHAEVAMEYQKQAPH